MSALARIVGAGLVTALAVALGGRVVGPRLLRIEPIVDTDRRPARRLATIVAEQILDPTDRSPALSDQFVISTSIAPVTLRVAGMTPTRAPALFSISSRAGGALVDA